ncbi:MAG: hypothetical protein JNL88_03460 [Bacteroidia bacterium]|nr:hypothetical protein [Bacteroidia bacterium]
MIRAVYTLFFLLLLHGAVAQHAPGSRYFSVPVQFVVVNGDFDESVVYMRRGGETVATFKGQHNMKLRLEYDTEYRIDFTKPGYITKSIRVDTKVPADRRKQGFDPYKIGVRLFKQYDGVNIVIYNQPVAFIRYLAEIDEFGYDTDYTKSILSQLKETEEILEKKAREERMVSKQDKSPEQREQPAISIPAGRPSFETMLAAEPMPLRSLPLPFLHAEVMAAPRPVNLSALPVLPEEQATVPHPPQQGDDPQAGSDPLQGVDQHGSGSGDDGREIRDTGLRTSGDSDRSPGVLLPEYTLHTEVEKIVEHNRVITVLRIREGEHTREYRSIQYTWGGLFYFMDDSYPVSEHLFQYLTRQVPLR